jgi:UDP-N-acetylglucosamine transferase subunit ALG13
VRWIEHLSPREFRETLATAKVVVAHAGIGTILTALELGVPALVLPRRAALREMRNDHQLATARRLGERGLVAVAYDESELRARLDDLTRLGAPERIPSTAPDPLIQLVRAFIDGRSQAALRG